VEKNINANVTFVETGSRRLWLTKCSHTAKFRLISVANVNSARTDEFISVLSSIEHLSSLYADCTTATFMWT